MRSKMAYLIIAHKYDETFTTLCRLLDNEHNDIFIHMDKKNKNYDENNVTSLFKKSNVYYTKRTSVAWGGV